MILGIDVSHELGLLTLELPAGELLTRHALGPREHLRFLSEGLAELRRESGRPWSELSRVAVTVGPGSFTGLRIGLATAKGLVFGQAIPLAPLPSLLVPALAHANPLPAPLLVCRRSRGEEYWAARVDPGGAAPVDEERLDPRALRSRAERLALAHPAAALLGSLPVRDDAGAWPLPLFPEPAAAAQLNALAHLAREAKQLLAEAEQDSLQPRYLAAPAVTPGRGRRATSPAVEPKLPRKSRRPRSEGK